MSENKDEVKQNGRLKKKKDKVNLYSILPTNMDYSNIEENINIKSDSKKVKIKEIDSKDFQEYNKNKSQGERTPFTNLCNDIADDEELGLAEKGLYWIIKRYYNFEWGYAELSYKKLKQLTGVKDNKTIQKYLIKLIERGLIQVIDSETTFHKKNNEIYKFRVLSLIREYYIPNNQEQENDYEQDDFIDGFEPTFELYDPKIDDEELPF